MEQNIGKLSEYYRTEHNEDNRLIIDRTNTLEFITTMHFLNMLIPKNSTILDACAGCGIYSFALANEGHIVTAGDVVEHNLNIVKEKQLKTPILKDIYQGNILDLSRFEDNSFDVVLNFGAYYHMMSDEQRSKSIAECIRVLRKSGLFCMAYLNRYCNFVKYSNKWSNDFSEFEQLIEKGFSGEDSLFYSTTPEAVENEIESFGLELVKNVATDGLKFAYREAVNNLKQDIFEKFLKCHFVMCETKSLLGYSEHALIIGRK